MALTRIQRQWVRLSTNNPHRRFSRGKVYRSYRRRLQKSFKYDDSRIKIHVIDAVTGSRTTAYAVEDSARKLKKWLQLRNVRAQFQDMVIPPNSIWSIMCDEHWTDYPVIIQTGDYKATYLIDHIGDKFPKGKKQAVTVFLKIVDNMDYLALIYNKREQVKTLLKLEKAKVALAKKSKKKKK